MVAETKNQTKSNGTSNGAAAAAATASAKKKKSKKAQPAAPIDTSKYEQFVNENKLPIKVQFSQNKGRHAVAAEDLETGTIVCNERATSLIISTQGLQDYCHNCVQPLIKASLRQEKVSCGKCAKASYCSAKCQKADAARHTLECPLVPKLYEVATKHELNVDLLRLILSLITRRVLEQKKQRMLAKGAEFTEEPGPPVGPFFCVEDLPVHRDAFEKTWLKAVTGAAKTLQEVLPETLATPEDDIIDYACRINSNAHSLSDEEGSNPDTAFGLFPVGSLFFRHSCAPNCHFVGGYGILTYRTTRPIKAGEELLVSHVELYNARPIRKQELKLTKHFHCRCSRCEVPMRKSVDRYLDGVLCRECHTGVYLSEKDLPKEEVEKLKEAKAAKGGKKGKKKSASPEKEEEVKENGETSPEETPTIESAHCDVCGHAIPHPEVQMIQARAQQEFRDLYQHVMRPGTNQAQVANLLNQFVNFYGHRNRILHPYNATLHNARIPLQHTLFTLGDYAHALAVAKETVDIWEKSGVVPGARQEYVDMLCAVADCLEKLGRAKAGGAAGEEGQAGKKKARQGSEMLSRNLLKESREYYRRALEVGEKALG
ncbi:hypothetical protein HDV00_012681, partial [Rhizophlyctis rosea]